MNCWVSWDPAAWEIQSSMVRCGCRPIFMHQCLSDLQEQRCLVIVGHFDLGTLIFLQQGEHGRAHLLYTHMPLQSRTALSLSLYHRVPTPCRDDSYS